VLRAALLSAIVLGTTSYAAAQAPEPSGAHPRILLDDKLRATWKKQAKEGAVARALARCDETRSNPKEFQRDSYMGFDWSASASACLIAWVVRGADADAKQALVFVEALLDDLQMLGDKKGGEAAVRRDTGYAIRSLPIYPAIAYDWLYSHPAMTPALKQKIRERLDTWLAWYKKGGYHRRTPANNYHAGYLWAASLTAIALGGEKDEFISELWKHVRDDIWGTDMAKALAPGGLLDGGDFPEGWQYAPLSVVEYAVAARIVENHGIKIDGVDRWLTAMFARTIHARSGALDTIAAIGDTQDPTASIKVNAHTMLAIMAGPSQEIAQKQAAAEKQRLGLVAKDYYLFEALAQAREIVPSTPALEKWPTSYYAPGVRTFYARTSWAKDGVWLSTICMPTPNEDADHMQPAAGNFTVTRGSDEILVDPSPYGSLSTLTTNAPTVDSKQLPVKYRPSQGPWGEAAHYKWAQQTASGVMVTRCDYADQYKFQERSSDISFAQRDIVLVPWGKTRSDASIVIIDRGQTSGADYQMYLRFRTPGVISLTGNVATSKTGATTLAIHHVRGGKPEVKQGTVGECWNIDRGKCDLTRIPTGEYRVTIPGPEPEAVNVLDVSADGKIAVASLPSGAIHLKRAGQDAYVTHLIKPGSYTVTPSANATHVVLSETANAKLTVTKDGASCKVELTGDGGPREPAPFVVVVDATCKATDDQRTGPASPDLAAGSAAGTQIPVGGPPPRSKTRGGCCATGGGEPLASTMLFGLVALRLRRRR
jgi:hypothetical protein